MQSPLKKITIPNSITKIGKGAFESCFIQEINLYSYKQFDILDYDLRYIAILSMLKNYYLKTIQYSKKDIELFKKYIINEKPYLLNFSRENIYLIKFMLEEINGLITYDDLIKLIDLVKTPEVKTFLLEYKDNHYEYDTIDSILDRFNLDDEETHKEKK